MIKNNAINKVILSFQDRMNFSQAYSLEIKQMEIKIFSSGFITSPQNLMLAHKQTTLIEMKQLNRYQDFATSVKPLLIISISITKTVDGIFKKDLVCRNYVLNFHSAMFLMF